MNFLPRFALCNNGCAGRSTVAGLTTTRIVRFFVCMLSGSNLNPAVHAKAAKPFPNLVRVLRPAFAAFGVGLIAAVLTGALLSEDYSRGVQGQTSGYAALNDKLAGNAAGTDMRGAARARPPGLPKRAGL